MEETSWTRGTRVTAIQRFDSCGLPHVLSFISSETFTIQAKLDSNWYYARNQNGKEGYIPTDHLLSLPSSNRQVKIKIQTWFHGLISRNAAEEMLQDQSPGAFLIRDTTSSFGDHVLCVRLKDRIENFIIVKRKRNGRLAIKGDDVDFDDLADLVEYYKWNNEGIEPRLTSGVPRRKVTEEEKKMFEDKGWVIERPRVVLKEYVGKGSFSEVHQGRYLQKAVAIKVFKEKPMAAQSFLAEASLMTYLNHDKLVQLEGVMFHVDHLYLVMEFMKGGSLETYLRSRGRRDINNKLKLEMAIDVCDGMTFLESKRIAHCDLASRNILLTEKMVAKIGDFGLSCYENMNVEGQLPVKWTAPEGYRRRRFNSNTDMWSFGVLLWEIYSYGRIPYNKVLPEEIIEKVEAGLRMERPEDCPSDIYDLMKQCWQEDPSRRPSFSRMHTLLNSQLKTPSW